MESFTPEMIVNRLSGSVRTDQHFSASLGTKGAFQLYAKVNILTGHGSIFDSTEYIGSPELLCTSVDNFRKDTTAAMRLTFRYINEIYQMLIESRCEVSNGNKLLDMVFHIAICGRLGRETEPGSM